MRGLPILLGLGAAGAVAGAVLLGRRGATSPPFDDELELPATEGDGWSWATVVSAVAWAGERSSGWGALNPRDRTSGASWGALQFNQGAGSLGQVLRRWSELDPAGFRSYWAGADGTDYGSSLVRILTDSSRQVRLSIELGQGAIADRLRAAGEIRAAKQAQVEVAWSSYMAPVLPGISDAWGGPTTLVCAVVFDRSINQGPVLANNTLRGLFGWMAGHPGQLDREGAIAWYVEACIAGAAAGDGPAIRARVQRVMAAVAGSGEV